MTKVDWFKFTYFFIPFTKFNYLRFVYFSHREYDLFLFARNLYLVADMWEREKSFFLPKSNFCVHLIKIWWLIYHQALNEKKKTKIVKWHRRSESLRGIEPNIYLTQEEIISIAVYDFAHGETRDVSISSASHVISPGAEICRPHPFCYVEVHAVGFRDYRLCCMKRVGCSIQWLLRYTYGVLVFL